mmetsp:Transcript_31747/g.91453  ORF Transcript_31747/g.91453 Transcript_31747/m.91453 type:complete len:202 (-) Transcript_31747:607-1212(-)
MVRRGHNSRERKQRPDVGRQYRHRRPELGLSVQHVVALESGPVRGRLCRDRPAECLRAPLCGHRLLGRHDHLLLLHLYSNSVHGGVAAHQHGRDPTVLAAAALSPRLGRLAVRRAESATICGVHVPKAETAGADQGCLPSDVALGAVARGVAQRDPLLPSEGAPALRQPKHAHPHLQQGRVRGVLGQGRRCLLVWRAGPCA